MTLWKNPATGWTHLSRLTDGRVLCSICMEYKTRDQLQPVANEPGRRWDVCQTCAALENQMAADAGEPPFY